MIKQLLCILFIALTPVISPAWAVDQAPVVEQYPDEMPKKTLIFQQKVPEKLINLLPNDQILDTINSEIPSLNKIFLDKGYQALPMINKYEAPTVGRLSFYCFVNMKETEHSSFFVGISLPDYRVHSDILASFEIHKNPLPFDKKWEYPFYPMYWGGHSEVVNEMSWSCLDLVIHHKFKLCCHRSKEFKNDVYKKLFQDIREFGLEKCFARLLIVRNNKEDMYDYYSLSDSSDDQQKIQEQFDSLILFI